MADKKITDFPEISSIGANDVFLVGGTNATYKAKLAALRNSIGAVSKSGDTMTGQLNLKPAGSEGGQILLGASSDHPEQAGINIDQYGSKFRIFGQPSADGTSITGSGTTLYIDPYAKTITGGYTFTGNVSGNATNVTGTVQIANGGTGATTAAAARTNLGIGGIGTVVENSVDDAPIEFSNNTLEVCRISLAAGTWVISANLKIQGATVGARQGAGIANIVGTGFNTLDAYELISINDTGNHYINVSRIVTPIGTTTYYLFGYAETTRTVSGRIRAVRII